jgi:hypothetical protein
MILDSISRGQILPGGNRRIIVCERVKTLRQFAQMSVLPMDTPDLDRVCPRLWPSVLHEVVHGVRVLPTIEVAVHFPTQGRTHVLHVGSLAAALASELVRCVSSPGFASSNFKFQQNRNRYETETRSHHQAQASPTADAMRSTS